MKLIRHYSILHSNRFYSRRLACNHCLECTDQYTNKTFSVFPHGPGHNVRVLLPVSSLMVADRPLAFSTAAACIARTSLSWQLKAEDVTCK